MAREDDKARVDGDEAARIDDGWSEIGRSNLEEDEADDKGSAKQVRGYHLVKAMACVSHQ